VNGSSAPSWPITNTARGLKRLLPDMNLTDGYIWLQVHAVTIKLYRSVLAIGTDEDQN